MSGQGGKLVVQGKLTFRRSEREAERVKKEEYR